MARMVNVEDIVFDLSGLQFIPPTDFRAIGEYFARQLRELPVIDLTKEGLLPDGTLHLFTDTDLSKVTKVMVSQNGTRYGGLYYADEDPKIGKWIPCSKRLPEKIEKSYWVCTDSGYQCSCKWKKYPGKGKDIWTWHLNAHVVAWMPLPEPWKGEKQ